MKKMLSMLIMLLIVMNTASALAACPGSHRFGSWRTKTSATCTRQGHQFKYCQDCDHWEQRRTPKLPHTLGEKTVTKAPTCTETGREEGVCTVCNSVVRTSIDMLPHNYGELTVTKEPTCTAAGTGAYTCADCGKTKRENIAKLGHDMGELVVTKAPTCTASGTGETTCKRCGYVRSEKLNRTEHAFGEWTVTREPQGKRKGQRESVCAVCQKSMTESFYWEGTLYEGMEANEEVIRLQEMLRDLGFYKGNIRSGTFGSLTTSAVASFQQSCNLEGSGVVDAQTMNVLERAWEAATGKTIVRVLEAEEMEAAGEAKAIAE